MYHPLSGGGGQQRAPAAPSSQSQPSSPPQSPPNQPAAPARGGQVPSGERSILRLCVLSCAARRARGGELDLEASAAAQQRLAALGFGVGLGLFPAERAALGWEGLRELVRRAGALSLARGFVAGASAEQAGGAASVERQLDAVVEQAAAIEEAGGIPLVLPLAFLSRRRCKEDEYVEVYRALLARLGGPVLVDWTGPRVRPELLDYFPGRSFERVMALEPAKVRGARFALLDVAREVRVRRELASRDQLLFSADRAGLAHVLLGVNPSLAGARAPAPARHVELAGRSVALGDFSHAMLEGFEERAEALSRALEALPEGGDLFLERMSALG